jgi:hypothetical protein
VLFLDRLGRRSAGELVSFKEGEGEDRTHREALSQRMDVSEEEEVFNTARKGGGRGGTRRSSSSTTTLSDGDENSAASMAETGLEENFGAQGGYGSNGRGWNGRGRRTSCWLCRANRSLTSGRCERGRGDVEGKRGGSDPRPPLSLSVPL